MTTEQQLKVTIFLFIVKLLCILMHLAKNHQSSCLSFGKWDLAYLCGTKTLFRL